MAISTDSGIAFDIEVTGETSGKHFMGGFRTKSRLSFREQLRIDQLRRELVGPDPAGNASPEAMAIAIALAELNVRLTETPQWWKESKNGLDLEDENVLLEVWQKVKDILKEEAEKKASDTKAAQTEIRESREKFDRDEQSAAQAAVKKAAPKK